MLKRCRGQAAIQVLGLLLMTLAIGGLSVDAALYYAAHQGMQNAADAAALAGAQTFFEYVGTDLSARETAARTAAENLSQQNMRNYLNDADIEFGYVDPISGQYSPTTFFTATTNPTFSLTGGYNAVRVTVRAGSGQANLPIPSIFTKFLGLNNFTSSAQAVAIFGGGVYSAGGLRPVYMCQSAWDQAQQLYGDPTIPQITFYGQTLMVGNTSISQGQSCGNLGPGNWGLADLNNQNGVPGDATVRDWFENGYNGDVYTATNYQSETGTPLNTFDSALNNLVSNQTVINIPLYDATSGNGANAVFHVSQIASFVITGYQTTGAQSQRYIQGYFKRSFCNNNCSLGNAIRGGGTTTLRLVH